MEEALMAYLSNNHLQNLIFYFLSPDAPGAGTFIDFIKYSGK
jgi:hypothetical protein